MFTSIDIPKLNFVLFLFFFDSQCRTFYQNLICDCTETFQHLFEVSNEWRWKSIPDAVVCPFIFPFCSGCYESWCLLLIAARWLSRIISRISFHIKPNDFVINRIHIYFWKKYVFIVLPSIFVVMMFVAPSVNLSDAFWKFRPDV